MFPRNKEDDMGPIGAAELLAWINQTHRQHSQRRDAWQKEIISASQLDKIWQLTANIGRVGCACVSLHDKLAASAVVAHQHIFVVAQMRIIAVFDPLLLYELKLARDACIERHEDDSALLGVRGRFTFGGEWPVG